MSLFLHHHHRHLLLLDATAAAPPPPPLEAMASPSSSGGWESRISPSILLIIAILAIVFFLSGLLHLLIRYLLAPAPPSGVTGREQRDGSSSLDATALQGQLQQLFDLHDAGVDQTFIDALPVFLYRSITGAGAHKKDPFDCAVCLCEFDPEDRLRLLPKCSHAFHLHCIDTWLLSHSTCPLCRRPLLPPSASASPAPLSRAPSLDHADPSKNAPEAQAQAPPPDDKDKEKVVAVKLGKYRTVAAAAGAGEGSSSAALDSRRCFSMGSFEYVMDESSQLRVAIKSPEKKKSKSRSRSKNRRAGRRMAMSEWDCESQREAKVVSKTWLRGCGRKEEDVVEGAGSRRVVSFRLPEKKDAMGAEEAEEAGSDVGGCDAESWCETATTTSSWNGGAEVVRRGEEMPSFARRTMLWVMGKNHHPPLGNASNRVGDHLV